MFLDIETLPAEAGMKDILLDLFHRKIAKNSKSSSPQTFAEYLETTGLDGSFGRICCISYCLNDSSIITLSGSEKTILEKFWTAAHSVDLFVGFNIMDFDLRFIYQRSIIFGVKPSRDLVFTRNTNTPIYDVFHEWTKWSNLGKIGLHGLAKALGLKSSKEGGIEGRDIAKAYAAGRLQDICDYCERDVELTRQIYRKLTFS